MPDGAWYTGVSETWVGSPLIGGDPAAHQHIQGVYGLSDNLYRSYLMLMQTDENVAGNCTLSGFHYSNGWVADPGGNPWSMKMTGFGHGTPFGIDSINVLPQVWSQCKQEAKIARYTFQVTGATIGNSDVTQWTPVTGGTAFGVTVSIASDGEEYVGIRYTMDGVVYYQIFFQGDAIMNIWDKPVLPPPGVREPLLADSEGKEYSHQGWTFKDRWLYIIGEPVPPDSSKDPVIFSVDLNQKKNNLFGWMAVSNPHTGGTPLEPEGITVIDMVVEGELYAGLLYTRVADPPVNNTAHLYLIKGTATPPPDTSPG